VTEEEAEGADATNEASVSKVSYNTSKDIDAAQQHVADLSPGAAVSAPSIRMSRR
jgi:hypothetical protein